MEIREIRNPWRDRYQQASFRGAPFKVLTDPRSGGRRVALHEYPKRNTPYAEDMGKAAVRFSIIGYLIGPNYLADKDRLIDALEKDGPGMLRVPLAYRGSDIEVMVVRYTVTETKDAGGFASVEMDFVEHGSPKNRAQQTTQGQVSNSAVSLEKSVVNQTTIPLTLPAQTMSEVQPYLDIYAAVAGGLGRLAGMASKGVF